MAAKPTWRRKLRRRQNQVGVLGEQAGSLVERYFFRRLDHLTAVRRFVIAWMLFFVLVSGSLIGQILALDSRFQTLQPIAGGVYTEGIVGDYSNANPLYASGDVDESVSKLLFAGLFTYDDTNKLTGDLAESFTVDPTEKIYTVKLKPGLYWHDGQPLTSRDVVFTYKTIQNPDTKTPLHQSWRNVTVTAPDAKTVIFTLPNVLASFPYHMTNGLIPEHILKDIPAQDLRSSNFNTMRPIGSGPFVWNKLELSGATLETREEIIALKPFERYHRGKPQLAGFVIHAYHSEERLSQGFREREITAATFRDMPEEYKDFESLRAYSFPLSSANMVFFRQGAPVLSDPAVRKALVQGANTRGVLDALPYSTQPVRSPLLPGQVGYDPSLLQPPYDPAAAVAGLEAAGWKADEKGIRTKDGQRLKFSLYAADTPEIQAVTHRLRQDWRRIGVDVRIHLRQGSDLQRVINGGEYDALLYGISVGVDPDVFVYWHSSQNDPRSNRLNFSRYASKIADESLEAGRTRIDPTLRAVKYKPFLQAWQKDLPALGLYQPRYLYLTHTTVHGLKEHKINDDTDRFNAVHTWKIRQAAVTSSPNSDLR